MSMPVDLVVQHHQGDGDPSDSALANIADSGYSYGIGATRWQFFRDPAHDFATAAYNHVSMGVCLTGNRNNFPVTQTDLRMMREIAAHARANGYVIDAPYVQPHREMPFPNQTICPGNQAAFVHLPKFPQGDNLTWVAIVAAYHKETVLPMPPKVVPTFFPPLANTSLTAFQHPTLGWCAAEVTAEGHVYTKPAAAYMGSPYDDATGKAKSYWLLPDGTGRAAAGLDAAPNKGFGYVITATTGETYGPKF